MKKIMNLIKKIQYSISLRLNSIEKYRRFIIDQFHILYFKNHKKTLRNTYWRGHPVIKCPLDLWIFQEIIINLKPDIIIESGTSHGGSAFFLASICDLVNNGEIFSIDIVDEKGRPQHKRINYLIGSSTSEEVIDQIREKINNDDKVMVTLDSFHTKNIVLNELKTYSKFVTKGSYLIVEDTNINGHPVSPHYGPGPMEAIEEFLKENNEFIIDKSKEKFYMTTNPNGYLKKIR